MSRGGLAFAVGALTLAVGIATALVQSTNHERARRLADLQRRWEHLEAINVQREARAAAHLPSPAGSAGEGTARGDSVRRELTP